MAFATAAPEGVHVGRSEVDALFRDLAPSLYQRLLRRASRWSTLRAWAEDAAAEVLLHVLEQLRTLRTMPTNLRAWLHTVTERRLTDVHRVITRRRNVEAASLDDLDPGLVPWELDLRPDAQLERALDLRRTKLRFAETLRLYTERAARNGGRGHHLHAWVQTRLLERGAPEVASELQSERGEPVSAVLVWKWSERGRRLLLNLADADPVPERGAWMRTVLEGVG